MYIIDKKRAMRRTIWNTIGRVIGVVAKASVPLPTTAGDASSGRRGNGLDGPEVVVTGLGDDPGSNIEWMAGKVDGAAEVASCGLASAASVLFPLTTPPIVYVAMATRNSSKMLGSNMLFVGLYTAALLTKP
jgi:hypothetical protein